MVETDRMMHAWMQERINKEYTFLSPRRTPSLEPSEDRRCGSAAGFNSKRGSSRGDGDRRHGKNSHARAKAGVLPATPRITELGLGALDVEASAAGKRRIHFDHQGCLIVNPGERRKGGVPHPDDPAALEEVELPRTARGSRNEHFDHTGMLIVTPGRRPGPARISANAEDHKFAERMRQPGPNSSRFARYIFDHSGQMIHNVSSTQRHFASTY